MKKLALHVAAISVLLAGSASAADLRRPAPVKAPAPAPVAVHNWTGCYLGAGGGYGMFDQETQLITAATGVPINTQLDQGGRGWFGTVQGGCDFQVGSNFVIGVFADYDFSGIKGKHTGQSGGAVGLVNGDMDLEWSWAVGGRIGYLVTPTLLAFVSGGYTQAEFSGVTYASLAAPTGFGIPDQRYSGWFLGGGTEYQLTWLPIQGLFWKSEYRFASYRSKDVPVITLATGVPTGVNERIEPFVQTIRSELVWRFNFGGPVVARY